MDLILNLFLLLLFTAKICCIFGGFELLTELVTNVATFWDTAQSPSAGWFLDRLIFDREARRNRFLRNVLSHTN
jgi:hypothetical protein